jgi:hypothetical protein
VNQSDDEDAIRFSSAVTGLRTADLRARTLLDGGGTDRYAELAPTNQWFRLVPGDNTLTLTGAASVIVTWRPAWY